jgi:hypothetical protein
MVEVVEVVEILSVYLVKDVLEALGEGSTEKVESENIMSFIVYL